MTHTCTTCKKEKQTAEMHRTSVKGRDYYYYCKPCRNERRNKNYCSTKKRSADLMSKYGITVEEHDAMFEKQKGLCAICHKPESRMRNGKPMALAVDHCHVTNRVRGLLCMDCNTGLGKFKDNIDLLSAAQDYLK